MENTNAPAVRPTRVEREDIGSPITVGPHALRPVAQVSGWIGAGGDATGGGGGVIAHVRPTAVLVADADGSERRIRVTDPTGEAMRGMGMGAVALAVISLAVILVAVVVGRR